MARTLTARDVHATINEIAHQMQGLEDINVIDTSTFMSAGERILAAGNENVLNAISLVLGRTYMAVRPYEAKFQLMNEMNTGEFTHRLRKISVYSKDAVASGDWNTQLFTNFEDGFDNGENPSNGTARSTKSMWVQSEPKVLEINFAGSSVWQDVQTVYEYQLQQAFRSEDEFARFWAGVLTEKANDIEQQKEAFSRAVLLQHIGNVYDNGTTESKIDLTAAFNAYYTTTYTRQQILTAHLEDFLKFFVETVQTVSDRMTHRSALYHDAPLIDGYSLLRHTPKADQRLMLYNPFMIKARTHVLPGLFNDDYLKINQYEGIDYWQSIGQPAQVNVTPAIMNKTTGIQTAGATVEIPYMLGVLYDRDAMAVDFQLERANTTPLEARKAYRNIWYTFAKNGISDISENCVLFYMGNGGSSGGGSST